MTKALEPIRSPPIAFSDTAAPGGPERLRRLVSDHMELASRMVRNVGAPSGLIEDITQQAFQICAMRIADIELGKEKAFLVQTAIRLTANARREQLRGREVTTDDLGHVADEAPSPEDVSDKRRALRVLDTILAAMDLDVRAVFLLYEVEEMTMAEIAVVLDIPLGTVASRLRSAREDFLARARRTGLAAESKTGEKKR
ncbi:MAG: polymerase sigma-70 factor, subfamily [Myxococcales bacterium]|jgi:RNA polymerase sigma-70 factor (ECF subfamily)|nr:polymerase sigma-70 factor, subfamily [Myxococcales bacterium]